MFTNALSVMGSSETYEILLPLALILLCAKLFSLLGKKIGLPQVVGMLVAGILLGLLYNLAVVHRLVGYGYDGVFESAGGFDNYAVALRIYSAFGIEIIYFVAVFVSYSYDFGHLCLTSNIENNRLSIADSAPTFKDSCLRVSFMIASIFASASGE